MDAAPRDAAAGDGPAAAAVPAAAVGRATSLPNPHLKGGQAQHNGRVSSSGMKHPSSLLPASSPGGGNGAFKPTATAGRALAPATLAELSAPLASSGKAAATSPSAPPLPALPSKQLQAALSLYYQELQAFAAVTQLDLVPADGEPASPIQAVADCRGNALTPA
jgi:hypothetical protein